MSNYGNVQLNQIVTDEEYKVLGSNPRELFSLIMSRLDNELDSPLRLHATFPVADAKLNFTLAPIELADGAKRALPPIRSQVYTLPASSIDFQTQVTTGATFVVAWPATNTVGQFRRAGFSLLGDGSIQVLFSDEAASVGALANPGTVFVRSGIALGYIDLECTDILGYFKSAGSTSNVIENEAIFRFSAGSGGGSGSGDANSFTENLKHRLVSSYFEYVTPVVFEVSEQNLTDSATATYDIVNGVYNFANAADELITVQMFDAEFLSLDLDGRSVELHAEWLDSASSDFAAIFEVSLDGVNFEAVQMQRQGESLKMTGAKLLALPTNAVISEQLLGPTDTELNATSQLDVEKIVVLTEKYAARELVVEIDKLGSPTGSYIVSIHKDDTGQPGEILYSVQRKVSDLSSGLNVITLNGFRTILPAGQYHIVVSTDSAYKTSFSAGVNSIRVKTDSGDLKYILSGHIFDLRVRVESSAGNKKLKAIGIFYGEAEGGSLQYGYSQIQKFRFSGSSDVTEFLVTNFLPNADHLKIYDVSTGQVYRYPAFSIDGKTVKFNAGTFLVPNETIELFFDQSEGTGYDYSDFNANLLASNHLGSSDNTIDKSVSGRGILIRNALGELKELWLDESNNLNITNPKG